MAKFIGQKSAIIIFFLSVGTFGAAFAYLINLYMSTRNLGLSLRIQETVPPARLDNRNKAARSILKTELNIGSLTNLCAPDKGMSIPGKWKGSATELPEETDFSGSFRLSGTIFSEDLTLKRAVIYISSSGKEKSLREGDTFLDGIRIVKIGRNSMVISIKGVEHTVKVKYPEGKKRKTNIRRSPVKAGRARSRQAKAGDRNIKVSKLGENSYAVDESSVDYLTENINKLITYVRIIPYFESGNAAGFRMAAIRPGSVFQQLGFKAGDIIKNVNGVPLTSPEKIYTIFQNLKDEKQIEVDILRRGKKSSLKYEIR